MPFIEDCELHFNTKDLYKVLKVDKAAKETEIKKAYHKLSLKTHPDRVADEEKNQATIKFQILGKVYAVLSNKEKRAIYDETGAVDDEANESIDNWMEYWRLLFPGPTKETLNKFTKKYWGSDEEKTDLKASYLKHKGDLNKILEQDMYCRVLEDEPRYKTMIQEWIDSKEVPSYKAFTHEKKSKSLARKRKFEKEKEQFEEAEAVKNLNRSVGATALSLESIIAKRTKERREMQNDFFSQLEAKYVKPKKAKPTKKTKSKK